MSISSDHRSLDYHVISAYIMPMVKANASVCIKVLLNVTEAHFGFRPTYRRVWLAKQKVVAKIYGDWNESYNELPRWVLGVQLTMPGSVAMLRTSPVRVGGQVDESQAYFHRFFWTVPPCIEAFRHCKLLHVTPQPDILVISDRHNGIKAALEAPDGGWLPPAAYRVFCIRHVAKNFALTFKGKDARRLLVNAAYAKTEVEFDYWIEYAMWTQHRDDGRRYDHMTTNISECVNSILKGVRNLPVCSLVKATYGRLAELFVRKGREAEAEAQLGTRQQFS
ncbi:uncharacterized protein [Arachis hypogaea]|uniref:uncharacterized protein n=1 Tax=Arachis hypogaea TaxID=3818 RepID=UPI003B220C9D